MANPSQWKLLHLHESLQSLQMTFRWLIVIEVFKEESGRKRKEERRRLYSSINWIFSSIFLPDFSFSLLLNFSLQSVWRVSMQNYALWCYGSSLTSEIWACWLDSAFFNVSKLEMSRVVSTKILLILWAETQNKC